MPANCIGLSAAGESDSRISHRQVGDCSGRFGLAGGSDSAAAEEEEKAEHGGQGHGLERRDHRPNDVVHDRQG